MNHQYKRIHVNDDDAEEDVLEDDDDDEVDRKKRRFPGIQGQRDDTMDLIRNYYDERPPLDRRDVNVVEPRHPENADTCEVAEYTHFTNITKILDEVLGSEGNRNSVTTSANNRASSNNQAQANVSVPSLVTLQQKGLFASVMAHASNR